MPAVYDRCPGDGWPLLRRSRRGKKESWGGGVRSEEEVSTKDANEMSFEGSLHSKRCEVWIHWLTKRIWAVFLAEM